MAKVAWRKQSPSFGGLQVRQYFREDLCLLNSLCVMFLFDDVVVKERKSKQQAVAACQARQLGNPKTLSGFKYMKALPCRRLALEASDWNWYKP
jgi:hypothetical protein